MKMRLLVLALLLASMAQAQSSYKTLFLGNSYTYVFDLPGILQSLTLAGGDTLFKDSYTPGGYTLQGHSGDVNAQSKIRSQQWDFVVLQEQSQRPSFPQNQVQTQVYPYAAQLDDSIKANDSCTVTVFYMTWGRKNGDASNCASWPPVCTYAGMQYELRRSYLNMANQNSALVAPCGSAWWEAIKRDSLLELYDFDQSHPSYAGSYLNGCVFYATMYRESPVGLNFYGLLDTATAQFLQHVAHDVVFDSLTLWRVGLDDVTANWTWVSDFQGNTNFANSSSNATSYHWDFGDGGIDSVAQPLHQYNAAGLYPVTLIATDGCMTDTLTDTIEIILVGSPEPLASSFCIAPNPSAGLFTASGTGIANATLQVWDLQGRLLHQVLAQDGDARMQLDLRHLPKGVYLLRMLGGPAIRVLLQ
jgi:PKD domain/Secretion system C-terminal sorting domain